MWGAEMIVYHGSFMEVHSPDVFHSRDNVEFEGYTEEWLDFIISCRQLKNTSTCDLVIGGVANDKVFNTIELYLEGLIERTEAIKRLRYEKPNLQMCIRNQNLIEKYLQFIKSEEI